MDIRRIEVNNHPLNQFDIFTLSGSPHKCACNCKRIWERTGLDIINQANVYHLNFVGMQNPYLAAKWPACFCIIFPPWKNNVMSLPVLKFWTFLYSPVLAKSANFRLSRKIQPCIFIVCNGSFQTIIQFLDNHSVTILVQQVFSCGQLAVSPISAYCTVITKTIVTQIEVVLSLKICVACDCSTC